MKHFEKKIAQKTSIGSPAEIFITRYTVKIQNVKRVKNEDKRRIFRAKSSEKHMQTRQKSIRPPSSVERGMRLNTVSDREIAAKGSRNSATNGALAFLVANGKEKAKPKNPKNGPPAESKNSSRYESSLAVSIRAPSIDKRKHFILILSARATKIWPASCKAIAQSKGRKNAP